MQVATLVDSPNAVAPDPDPWLTLQAAAEEIHVCYHTLQRACRRGRLRHAKVGGGKSIRIRRSWLASWLEASSTPVEVRR